MKIAFLCRNLEKSRDGVGDYTRRLAAELIRQGHPSAAIGLNDLHVSETTYESQQTEGSSVPILRLPETLPWAERAKISRKWLDTFNPDWVSLQYVPFAFHPRGLARGLAETLNNIAGSRPLHWMFHELWVLWRFPLSLRNRFLGQAQKIFLRAYLAKLKPRAFATQLPIYQEELQKLGIAADIHPLHGNIPVYSNPEARQWLADRCAHSNENPSLNAGFFGSILPTLNPDLLASEIKSLPASKKHLRVFLAGKNNGEGNGRWQRLEQELKGFATFHTLGELDEREASYYFSSLDYGLTSYPPELMRKSGSVAAMREHGLPVIACGSLDKNPAYTNGMHNSGCSFNELWTVKQSALLLLQQLKKAEL